MFFSSAFYGIEARTIKAEVSSMNIHVINLGNSLDRTEYEQETIGGDAVLIESSGEFILMDTGSELHANILLNALKRYGVTTLSIYVSHIHSDHYGNLYGIASDSAFTIKKLYLPDKSVYGTLGPRITHYDKFEKLGLDTQYLKKGSSFVIGSANFNVIGPVNAQTYEQYLLEVKAAGNWKPDWTAKEEYSAATTFVNNKSLSCIVSAGGKKFFTGGDIYALESVALTKTYPKSLLNSDIMKLNHHGTPIAKSEELSEAISPTFSFACNTGFAKWRRTPKGRYVRKTEAQARIAQKYGMTLFAAYENKDLHYFVSNNKITTRIGSATSAPLANFVNIKGGTTNFDPNDNYYINPKTLLPQKGVLYVNGAYRSFEGGGVMRRGSYNANGEYNPKVYYNSKKTKIRGYYRDGKLMQKQKKIKSNYYYFNPSSFYAVIGKKKYSRKKIEGKYYFINNKGVIYNKEALVKRGADYYFVAKKGALVSGWKSIKKNKYYFDKKTNKASRGLNKIGKKYYYFDSGAIMKKSVNINLQGLTYKISKEGVVEKFSPIKPKKIGSLSVEEKKKSLIVNITLPAFTNRYEVYISSSKKNIKKNSVFAKTKKTKFSAREKNIELKIETFSKERGKKYYLTVVPVNSISKLEFKGKAKSLKI
jgi:beta-lactamase superfamily II metal-dependent hydrolase/glucan-binding YG repeat protein